MHRDANEQMYFVDAKSATANVDRLIALSGQRMTQLEFLQMLQREQIYQLKQLCKELEHNYKVRFTPQDKFLRQLMDVNLAISQNNELIDKLTWAIDSFCAGDFSAVREINGT